MKKTIHSPQKTIWLLGAMILLSGTWACEPHEIAKNMTRLTKDPMSFIDWGWSEPPIPRFKPLRFQGSTSPTKPRPVVQPKVAKVQRKLEAQLPEGPQCTPTPLKKNNQRFASKITKAIGKGRTRYLLIETDKPLYKPGETIWMRSFEIAALSNSSHTQKDGAIFTLRGPRGNVLKRYKLIAKEGLAAGSFYLSKEIKGGEYTLDVLYQRTKSKAKKKIFVMAYQAPRLKMKMEFVRKGYGPGDTVEATLRVKKASGEILANHSIRAEASLSGRVFRTWQAQTNPQGEVLLSVNLPKETSAEEGQLTAYVVESGAQESISRGIPLRARSALVGFFPEGGSLVADLHNRVYFAIRRKLDKKPQDIEGILEDQQGNKITEVRSYYDGMGRFVFVPKKKTSYFLRITRPLGMKDRYELPKVTNGVRLTTRWIDDWKSQQKDLQFVVESQQPRLVNVVAMQREQIVGHQAFRLKRGAQQIKLPLTTQQRGIVRVTFFDQAYRKPLTERLIFRHLERKAKIEIITGQPSYQPRETAHIKIRVTDPQGKPLRNAQVGVAVVDDTVLSYADDDEPHVLAQRFLTAPLIGKIHKPNRYFRKTNKQRFGALDLVMGTHGWRDFSWKALQKGTPPPALASLHDAFHYGYLGRWGYGGRRRVYRRYSRGYRGIGYGGGGAASGRALWGRGGGGIKRRRRPRRRRAASKRRRVAVQQPSAGAKSDELSQLLSAPLGAARGDGVEARRKDDKKSKRKQRVASRLSPQPFATTTPPAPTEDKDITSTKGSGPRLNSNLDTKKNSQKNRGNTKRESEPPVPPPPAAPAAAADPAPAQEPAGKVAAEKTPAPAKKAAEEEKAKSPSLANTSILVKESPKPKSRKPVSPRPRAQGLGIGGLFFPRRGRGKGRAFYRNNMNYWSMTWYRRRVFPVKFYGTPKPSSKPLQRSDFRETLFWAPSIKTDDWGEAKIKFGLNDNITSFRVRATVVGGGYLGRATHVFASKRPFFMAVRIPNEVSAKDAMVLPITLRNDSKEPLSLKAKVRLSRHFKLLEDPFSEIVTLQPNEGITTFLPIRVRASRGEGRVRISASSQGISDAVSYRIRIRPRGFPRRVGISGVLRNKKERSFSLQIPKPNDFTNLRTQLSFYTSSLHGFAGAAEGIIRQPYGCFEQTSSSNYPNVMVLRYLKQKGINNPRLYAKASRYIASGYKRLIGYEVKGGGFEWFGRSPAHEALTAYGLLQFLAMRTVYPVDQEMIQRTKNWLYSRKDGKGGFQTGRSYGAFGHANKKIHDAYITYALIEAGGQGLEQELAKTQKNAQDTGDAYLLALATLATQRAKGKNSAKARSLLRQLRKKQRVKGYFQGKIGSFTGSYGRNLSIETTSLAILAMLRAGLPEETISPAIFWLQEQRGMFGRYGATQATVLSLQSLAAFEAAHPSDKQQVALLASLNEKMFFQHNIQPERDANKKLLKTKIPVGSGRNKVKLSLTGKGQLPFGAYASFYVFTPPSAKGAPVHLELEMSKHRIKLGESTRLTATLVNTSKSPQAMTMARIAFPGGLVPQIWQLKELKEKKIVDFYELKHRELIVYLQGMAPEGRKTIHLDLVAHVTGNYTGPASSAYPYYNDDLKFWQQPLRVSIVP
ncbi:MAG: hypothetical protein H6727_19950 [Myxococcales bacterium]|nr:hypothetical protein [Myxococcales bacterium]